MRSVIRHIKWLVSKLGFEVNRIPYFSGLEHERILPQASYAPWKKDSSFLCTYDLIANFTLVDKYRCFELWSLIQQCQKLEFGSIIEIGVWRGGTGALIAKQAKDCGISVPVYLCDTFTGVVKAGSEDSNYQGGEHADTSRTIVEGLLDKLDLNNVKIMQGVFPEDMLSNFEKERFRFCHIDVDVFQSAKDVVDWIWPRMCKGGIIVFDDYGFSSCDGITKYVNEQMHRKDRLVFHNLNGHAIFVKL
ncbi:MAG: TylF/MycF/NovP-related O-methyltransferase [Bacteroidota bacterium]|nr:TylF/MycF/NovP-related O-methyltransferase [Bacteroidota bacterium]